MAGCTLQIKTKGVISELGEVTVVEQAFNPHVNIYDYRNEIEIVRTVQIECPGVNEDDVCLEIGENGINVKIEKKKLINECSVEGLDGHGLHQTFGLFNRQITFPDGPWQEHEDGFGIDKGILKMIFRKSVQKKFIRLSSRNKPPHYGLATHTDEAPSESQLSGWQD